MRVAVTGASGVVGSALVRHLVGAGHEVKALSRSAESSEMLVSIGAAPVPGDLLVGASLSPLVEGCEVVFNVAGVNEMCVRDTRPMEMANIDGVRNVMQACRRSGVRRLVHTSSAATIGERRGIVATEETDHRGYFLSAYERTKYLGERVLFEEAGEIDFVCVNPSSVQGPGRATGTGKIILDVVRGRLPFLVDAPISVVDIDDCARGHLLAAERGRRAERYILSGASLTVRDAISMVGELRELERSPRFLPGAMADAVVAIAESVARIAGRDLPFCREMVRVLRFGHVYDGSKAVSDLGLDYTPIRETLAALISWFEAKELLD